MYQDALLDVIESNLNALSDEVKQAKQRLRKLRRQTKKGDRYGQIESLEWLSNYAVHIVSRGRRLRETVEDTADIARIHARRTED